MLLSDVCLTSVCLSVAYIWPNSRTGRFRKTKIGTEVAHVTRDSLGHHFQGEKVKGQLVADDLNSQHAGTCSDVVPLVGKASTRTGLRSADSSNYSLPRLNTRVGERAFSYAGPAAWNQLPESIRQLQTTSFKHKLKTFLFTQCYNSAD